VEQRKRGQTDGVRQSISAAMIQIHLDAFAVENQ
jgi:hypothetical protein